MTKLMHMPRLQRMAYINADIARLNPTGSSEDPAVARRKAAERRERLRKHDEIFDIYPGCTLGASPPEAPPRWSAGTPDDRDD